MRRFGYGYVSTIARCIREGKFQGAVLQAVVPLVLLSNHRLCALLFRIRMKMAEWRGEEPVVFVNGLYGMQINPADRGVSTELCINRTREGFSTAHMRKILSNGMTVLDIGANIGYYALLEARLVPDGKIHAVEPVPENFRYLEKNLALNGSTNVAAYNIGLGKADGVLDMFVFDRYNWSSFVNNRYGNVVRTIPVPVMTLDGFIQAHLPSPPHLIRMDVEGFEYEILKGAASTLSRTDPCILCIEIHPLLMKSERTAECLAILEENRFRIQAIYLELDHESDRRFIRVLNRLRSIIGEPCYGYAGDDPATLKHLLARGCTPMVFFEKVLEKDPKA